MSKQAAWRRHDDAVARGEHSYEDPETGYQVFTHLGLLARGRCCGAGCRHCPYAHEAVQLQQRHLLAQQAAWLTERRPRGTPCLLFWSGGKDSYLAYRALRREEVDVTLLTTFDAATGLIAHQDIRIEQVIDQAHHLQAPLIGVPLHPERDYLEHLLPALALVPDCRSLAFGDLHLEHIRHWREKTFGADRRTMALNLRFPLWRVPYEQLLTELERSGASFVISAAAAPSLQIKPGDLFNRELIDRLPADVDAFGEEGEFHTRVVFSRPPVEGEID